MEAQANTTREQSNKKNIYDVGWRPSRGENGGVGKKKRSNEKQKVEVEFNVCVVS